MYKKTMSDFYSMQKCTYQKSWIIEMFVAYMYLFCATLTFNFLHDNLIYFIIYTEKVNKKSSLREGTNGINMSMRISNYGTNVGNIYI